MQSTKAVIDLWANFLANEKLVPTAMNQDDIILLISLSETMAGIQRPWISSHEIKQQTRRFVCQTAMDLGIDLPSMKHKFTGKYIIGRGLLDIWLKVYAEKFGDTYGTAASKEALRRNVKTRLSRQSKTAESDQTKLPDTKSGRTCDQEKGV